MSNDVIEIGQLVVRERQARVRVMTDELVACFHDDATVQTSWMIGSAQSFAAGGAQRSASSGTILNRLGQPVITVNGDRAFVELPSTTTRWIPVNGVEAVLSSFMRLLYRVERRDGEWKISALVAVNEAETLDPSVPGTDLGVDPAEIASLRQSYRFRAYTHARENGSAMSPDLLGTDRPAELDEVYRESENWMQGRG